MAVIFHNASKFTEFTYGTESEFEELTSKNSKLLFGRASIYIDLKPRIDSKSLGGSVPDALLFDLRDIDNPEFYLVEVELAKHDFYKHIFPQITKFFAFFRNPKGQNALIEKVFSVVQSDKELEAQFKQFLKAKEIFKFIKDTIEGSQNILLIIDEMKPELPEMLDTYTEWSKMVRILVLKELRCGSDRVLSLSPDFEGIELGEAPAAEKETDEEEAEGSRKEAYSEAYHLEGIGPWVSASYQAIKSSMLTFKPSLVFNPQKYYISIRDRKNFAYMKLMNKKLRITVMLPGNAVQSAIAHHNVKTVSEGVRKFYGGDCCTIYVENNANLDEVVEVLKMALAKNA